MGSSATTGKSEWLRGAVSDFGVACKLKLAGVGSQEALIRTPIDILVTKFGSNSGISVVCQDEHPDSERSVRPDYAVEVDQAVVGYLEVKAPGTNLDPETFTGHNRQQWDRLKDVPNLVYTNGTEWRLYRDAVLYQEARLVGGILRTAGAKLHPEDGSFATLLSDFLRWKPLPITSIGGLVRQVAPLTRLLRNEVAEALEREELEVASGRPHPSDLPFTGLAQDWRGLLFPHSTNDEFADYYAQTVTFALLLARSEGIDFTGLDLGQISKKLGADHSLMGKALQLLTDDVADDFKVVLDLLSRVIGAVNWPRIRKTKRNAYLHLYENFLETYDPVLRQKSGSYYTPTEVVEAMVGFAEQVLMHRLGKKAGFAEPDVFTIDPAMGTGTFLQSIIEDVGAKTESRDGPGAVAGAVTDLMTRLAGFEIQTGPYAVTELRISDIVRRAQAHRPAKGFLMYLADTLADPYVKHTQLASGLGAISSSRENADRIKAKTDVTVVIGNPPYLESAKSRGEWIVQGSPERKGKKTALPAPLDTFRYTGLGRLEHKLHNLYIYFWRWATWKVFDGNPGQTGVICFISPSGYVKGPAFAGMRKYLRETSSEGWIIDLTPEGLQPEVNTRIFQGVQQAIAVGVFVRKPNTTSTTPAVIHYRALSGHRTTKMAALNKVRLDDTEWRLARTEWTAPFTPAPETPWDDYPAMDDLFPWRVTGLAPHRTWVYGTTPNILTKRWNTLTKETDRDQKKKLFKQTETSALTKPRPSLPGEDTHNASEAFDSENGKCPAPVRIGYRTLGRQWIIPDARLIDRGRPELWEARRHGQVFTVEQHTKVLSTGPGLVFSHLLPDMDFFKGSEGGRTLPMLHPDGTPNTAPGLLEALGKLLNSTITVEDLTAYTAAIAAHPTFTETFQDELQTPGIRIPVTADPDLWDQAVALGQEVIWTFTYGATYSNGRTRPADDIRYPAGDPDQPLNLTPVDALPTKFTYDPDTKQLLFDAGGTWGPVTQEVVDYTVGGNTVIGLWFKYRTKKPAGKRTSPLDDLNETNWHPGWNAEFVDLLTALTRLTKLAPKQEDLLTQILNKEENLISRETLATEGVSWPADGSDRKVRHAQVEEATNVDGDTQLALTRPTPE